MDLLTTYGNQALFNASQIKEDTSEDSKDTEKNQQKTQKFVSLYNKLRAEISGLNILAQNLTRKTFYNQQGQQVQKKKERIITLKKKMDEGPTTEPYITL